MDGLRYLNKEIFKIILLNTKNEIICDVDISVGTVSMSIVHPREVFREAIKRSSSKIILMHNHPSGNIEPSKEDKNVTSRLIKCGELIGIDVIDHIIIGDGAYYSFKENMIIWCIYWKELDIMAKKEKKEKKGFMSMFGFNKMSKDMGIDLGTANTLVYIDRKSVV